MIQCRRTCPQCLRKLFRVSGQSAKCVACGTGLFAWLSDAEWRERNLTAPAIGPSLHRGLTEIDGRWFSIIGPTDANHDLVDGERVARIVGEPTGSGQTVDFVLLKPADPPVDLPSEPLGSSEVVERRHVCPDCRRVLDRISKRFAVCRDCGSRIFRRATRAAVRLKSLSDIPEFKNHNGFVSIPGSAEQFVIARTATDFEFHPLESGERLARVPRVNGSSRRSTVVVLRPMSSPRKTDDDPPLLADGDESSLLIAILESSIIWNGSRKVVGQMLESPFIPPSDLDAMGHHGLAVTTERATGCTSLFVDQHAVRTLLHKSWQCYGLSHLLAKLPGSRRTTGRINGRVTNGVAIPMDYIRRGFIVRNDDDSACSPPAASNEHRPAVSRVQALREAAESAARRVAKESVDLDFGV